MKRLIVAWLLLSVLFVSSCVPFNENDTSASESKDPVTVAPSPDDATESTGGDEMQGSGTPTPTPTPTPDTALDDGFPNDPESDGTKRY